jgi:hypothetical protein
METTSIAELPMNPAGLGGGNNIAIKATENNYQTQQMFAQAAAAQQGQQQYMQSPPPMPAIQQSNGQPPMQQMQQLIQQQQQQQMSSLNNGSGNGGGSLDQSTISQLVMGLQQANSTGATQLPSRDIPQNMASLVQDPNIQQNYIPMPPQGNYDYISAQQRQVTKEDILRDYQRKEQQTGMLDEAYNNIQTPLLLGVLYFLFQLPVFKQMIQRIAPFLYKNDGNINLNGLLFNSILFGVIYIIITTTMSQFNKF